MNPHDQDWEIRVDQKGRLERRSNAGAWIRTGLDKGFKVPVHGRSLSLPAFVAMLGYQQVEQNLALIPQEMLLRIGHKLASALFGGHTLPEGGGRIRLVPEAGQDRYSSDPLQDALVRSIPWLLLARPGRDGEPVFLARDDPDRRWIVTLARGQTTQVRFPTLPRILIAAPRVHDLQTMDPEKHLKRIFEDLPVQYRAGKKTNDALIRVVRKWSEFYDLLSQQQFVPHLIYFYGHGVADDKQTSFIFERDEDTFSRPVDVLLLRKLLQTTGIRPHVLFANCCQGEATVSHGIGTAVSDLVDTVIANRGKIPISDARHIGTSLMRRIVNEQQAPHRALIDFYDRDLSAIAGADEAARWAAPVLYCNYAAWWPQSLPRMKWGLPESLFYRWLVPERVGRDHLSARVQEEVKILRAQEGPCLCAVFWRSAPEQGLREFAVRLQDDLREAFPALFFAEVTVEAQLDTIPNQAASASAHQEWITTAIGIALSNARSSLGAESCAVALSRQIPARSYAANSIITVTYRSLALETAWILPDILETWISVFRDASLDRPARLLLALPLLDDPRHPWMVPTLQDAATLRVLDLTPNFGPLQQSDVLLHLEAFDGVYGLRTSRVRQEKTAEILNGSESASYADVVRALRNLIGAKS